MFKTRLVLSVLLVVVVAFFVMSSLVMAEDMPANKNMIDSVYDIGNSKTDAAQTHQDKQDKADVTQTSQAECDKKSSAASGDPEQNTAHRSRHRMTGTRNL